MFFRRFTSICILIILLFGICSISAAEEAPVRTPLWTFQTEGAIWSSPAVSNGVIYVGSDDFNLYAVDAQAGTLKWKFASQGVIRCRPAVVDGRVFFASDDGFLYVLDIETGEQVWSVDIGNAAAPRLYPDATSSSWDYQQSSPVVSDGTVYIGSTDGNVYALNAENGEVVWKFATKERIRATPAVVDGTLYVGSFDGHLYAVEITSGTEKWQFDMAHKYIKINSSPIVSDGVVFAGGRDQNMYAIHAETGEKIWSYYYIKEWVESTPALAEGMIFVGSSMDYRLYALDTATGERVWDFDTSGLAFSSPVVADGVVYMGSMSFSGEPGGFYAISTHAGEGGAHIKTEEALWRVEIGPSIDTSTAEMGGVESSPAVVDGVVYFGGLDGKLYAVSTAS